MNITVLLLAAVLMSGCAGWTTFRSSAVTQGARVADEALDVSEHGVCEAPTMGAWQRRYGNSPEKVAAWAKLCSKSVLPP